MRRAALFSIFTISLMCGSIRDCWILLSVLYSFSFDITPCEDFGNLLLYTLYRMRTKTQSLNIIIKVILTLQLHRKRWWRSQVTIDDTLKLLTGGLKQQCSFPLSFQVTWTILPSWTGLDCAPWLTHVFVLNSSIVWSWLL